MESSVEIHRIAHEAFNGRDWERMRSLLAETVSYDDRPRSLQIRSVEDFIAWLQEWVTGMSDARVTAPEYIDAGEYSICRFTGQGTNDGPMGSMQATTSKRMDMPFCEILRVESGRITGGDIYYDRLTMLTQLGLAEVPVPA